MSYLDDLLASTRRRIDEAEAKYTPEVLEQRIAAAPRAHSLRQALSGDEIAIIAEIKRATPRTGELNRDLNASEQARAYVEGGAAAISVLTEPEYFWGTLADLSAASAAGLPVIRKDFLLDQFQLFESRAFGADAVLLIVRVLGDELAKLIHSAQALGMDALVEVHDDADLDRALDAGAGLIGVNHRDLTTFEIDPERTAKLAPRVPEDAVLVALSGVASRSEVEELAAAGARAVLVGEALVTAADPAAKLKELRGL
jgi:indole-3-glycerol phosphate synthase